MTRRRLAIDIVVPLYNEEGVVAEFHRRLMDVVTPLRREHDVRICYVNDGSVDATGAELLKLAADDAGVTGDNARLAAILGEGSELVYTTEQRVRLLEVGIHRLLCPVAVRPFIDTTYCPTHRGLVDARTFSYGWRVHRLARRGVERAPSPT